MYLLNLTCRYLWGNKTVLGVRYSKSRYYLGTLPTKTGQVPT
jgi:hypothetical protein